MNMWTVAAWGGMLPMIFLSVAKCQIDNYGDGLLAGAVLANS